MKMRGQVELRALIVYLKNFRTHASFGKAIQNPTFIEYFGYFGNFIGNPNLKPEKSIGGDLGLFIESTDKKHSLDITYFARNVENFISTNAAWTQAINLDGKTKIKAWKWLITVN